MKYLERYWLIVVCALLLANSAATAKEKVEKDKPAYFLYGDPKPGTKFKQKLFKANVPFDKRYSEMSTGLQNRVKEAYGGLKESEHPPFPSKGMQAIYRPLYKANRDLADEGDVLAIAMIKADGTVEGVSIYKAPTKNIATMVNYILVNTDYDHATCDGKPCKMEFLFETRIETKPAWTR